jgi:hypothetical protein
VAATWAARIGQAQLNDGGFTMPLTGQVRWGIISTANIARTAFLPGPRAVGGLPVAVASRNRTHAEDVARANGVERAIEGCQNLIDHLGVAALYIPLPNGLPLPAAPIRARNYGWSLEMTSLGAVGCFGAAAFTGMGATVTKLADRSDPARVVPLGTWRSAGNRVPCQVAGGSRRQWGCA